MWTKSEHQGYKQRLEALGLTQLLSGSTKEQHTGKLTSVVCVCVCVCD
jgi:hypothetical protein